MPSSVQRWRRIERILDGALDLEPEQRLAYLIRTCTGDEKLREEVVRLLRSCERARDFLETPARTFAEPVLAAMRSPGPYCARPDLAAGHR